MAYKILRRMTVNGNTLITVDELSKPIRIGETINNGKSKVISVALSGGISEHGRKKTTDLLVSGDFKDEELIY